MGRNAEVLRRFFDGITKLDPATAAEVIADEVEFTMPGSHRFAGTYTGKAEWKRVFGGVLEVLKEGLEVELHAITEDDDEHAVALLGVRATRDGQIYEWGRAFAAHIGDGKITKFWIFEAGQDQADAAMAG